MFVPKLALKQGRPVGGRRVQACAKRKRRSLFVTDDGKRGFKSASKPKSHLREELAREHVRDLETQQRAKKQAEALQKDTIVSILSSSATKRDARSYLQRFTPSEDSPSTNTKPFCESQSCGVNLGRFYGPAAVQGSPKFVQEPEKQAKLSVGPQLHIALVKIRAPQTLSDETLGGIGRTLAQLARLGLISVVVVDCNDSGPASPDGLRNSDWKDVEIKQANRLIAAIDANIDTRARLVENIVGVSEELPRPGIKHTRAYVTYRKLLMTPLKRSVIPVIPSIGYYDSSQLATPVLATDIVLALTRELAGLASTLLPDEDPDVVEERLQALRKEVSLDRLIVLDPLGGIPSTDRKNGFHIFLNMEQEFEPTKQELLRGLHLHRDKGSLQAQSKKELASDLGFSNPFSMSAETDFGGPKPFAGTARIEVTEESKAENWYYLQNLQLVRSVLSMLPPSSSALLTTPDEAANSGNDAPFQAARVGTRRQRNPLIHNLLTDKPIFSSSLPVGRLGHQTPTSEIVPPAESITPTTFAKHGMSVTTFPNPMFSPWEPPIPGQPHLTLTDSQIDLPRLVYLIEDSFGRKLDVKEYLKRVNGRVAGVIIAGEYEGGALLTWETPPGVVDDGSPESRSRMVPYLDKFAVLKRAQGSGGVADLIFKAMIRDCFPRGCVWRSRRNNPVNKWYFERSRGTWKIPETGWTMFWTTPDMSLDRQLFLDYEGVCKRIEPSWADNKQVLD
ncbi:acetylglutamate synthase [Diplocarpon rosae]|nr:acetylglutamate synthase [Diplocarpon rosae]